ncbi:MAG: anti-sigma factor family protein [Candidatus Krumholzibacteriia bacterium]
MGENLESQDRPGGCRAFRADFQAYVDGGLTRERSLELFLHARDCRECAAELAAVKALFARLDALPPVAPPADFEARILASVPYAAYRAMEPLRRERVPVYLEENFLPAPLRAPLVRAAGVALAVVTGAGLLGGRWPDIAVVGLLVGLLPEAAVRLQRLARRRYGRVERSESG